MKLNYMKLKNFRSYYGEQTIRFATDSHRCVTIIHGKNGAGKTSMFTALNWCLYGDAFVRANMRNVDELVNNYALANLSHFDTSVEIGFVSKIGFGSKGAFTGKVEFRAKRQVQVTTPDRGITHTNSNATFLLEIVNGPEFRDSAASNWIKSIIPESVSIHFFLEGEKIDNFAKPQNEDEVRNAVRNVLNIEPIERGIKHLQTIAGEYRRDLAKFATGNLASLLRVREAKQLEFDKQSKEVERLQRSAEIAKKQKRDVAGELAAIASSRQIASERKEIEADLKQLSREKEELRRKIRSLANQGFIPLAKPVIDKALEILDKNEIPRGVPEPLLKELLDQMRCLCGRPIHHGGPEHQSILNLLNQSVSPELANALRKTYSDLGYLMRDQVKNIPEALRSALIGDQQLDLTVEEKSARLEEIRELLVAFDDDEVRKREATLQKYEADIRSLEAQINQVLGRIQRIDEEIADLDLKIKRAEVSMEKAKQLKRYADLAEESASEMENIYELFEEDMRESIEVEVSEIFKRLVSKENQFQEVRISEDYALRVIDRDGKPAEKSDGEHHVLSLAFIAAVAKVAVDKMLPDIAAEPYPIVMDAPFGRLDAEHRENITEVLPEIATQLILFVTNTELMEGGQPRKNLEPRIGAEYELLFDDETGVTRIQEIRCNRDAGANP